MYYAYITVLGLGPIGGAFEIAVDGNPVSDTSRIRFSSTEHRYPQGLLEQERVDKKKNMMVEVSGLELPLGKFFAMSWKMGIKAWSLECYSPLDCFRIIIMFFLPFKS
ncbi:hypothetical protein LIER_43816 [Lithospermum erythrorhizon]|uniref:Uncharacterized protein n=1 Tax=Lithospermum erythrorhizon TaxID=34254 RepID=A0AAV3QY64_LITER